MIAADINNNGSVAASDIIQLRKLILGINNDFPSNRSWRFVDAKHHFADLDDIKSFPEEIFISELQGPIAEINFVGIKIGDVDQSHANRFNNISTRSKKVMTYTIKENNDHTELVFRIPAEKVVGGQFSLIIDNAETQLLEVKGGTINLSKNNFRIRDNEINRIDFSWDQQEPIDPEKDAFSLIVRTKSVLPIGLVSLDADGLSPELYTIEDQDISVAGVDLIFKDNDKERLELHQNFPNPFQLETRISYSLPNESPVIIKVFDLTGKLLFVKSENGTKGPNSFTVRADELSATGVLYYRIETPVEARSKKMIVIE
jgi:hypothetical protein